jgi:hypothetical protein
VSPGSWRWLALLPVAVVLVVVASASRLQLFWWPGELHEGTTGKLGEEVRVTDEWTDSEDRDQVRELDLIVAKVAPATTVEGFDGDERVRPAAGTAVWEIVLRFQVDPEIPLGGCYVSLLDSEDREAKAVGGSIGDLILPATSCVPIGASGPMYDGTYLKDSEPRPANYQVEVYAVTAEDFEPERLRLWWEAPDYVEVDLTE